ncbi:MAG: VWA domain-containing protein [Vicinamibacterales bacterium]
MTRAARAWAGGLVALPLAVTPAATLRSPASAQTPVFHGAADTVPIYATVIGSDGHLVTDLRRDEFRVTDDGRPSTISIFDGRAQPITLVLMLDTSGSMVGNLPVLRRAASELFGRLRPGDRVAVGSFGDDVRLSGAFTDDAATLDRALEIDLRPGGATPLWQAVNTAMTALASFDGRRVVLALTDGHDTGYWRGGMQTGPSAGDVMARAQQEAFMVYAIGMRSRGAPGSTGGLPPVFPPEAPDAELRLIAAESGGGYFELAGTEDLADVFARVADELRQQYLLGFVTPRTDGALHALDVRVTRPGVNVRARRSYVAPGRPGGPKEDR